MLILIAVAGYRFFHMVLAKTFFLEIPCLSNNFRNVANSFPATLGGCGPNGVCALVRPARPKSATPGGGVKVRAGNEVLLEYLKI